MRYTHIPLLVRKVYDYKGFRISRLFLTEKELRFFLQKRRKTGICPRCGKHCRRIEASYERTIRDLDFSDRKVWITFREFKIVCSCGYRGMEKLDFVDKYSFHTKGFEGYVALLCEKMSLKDSASIARIDWKTAKQIDKKNLRKLIVPLSQLNPEAIGVDEIAYEKGHKYLTILRDIATGSVIWIGIGRREETLDGFFNGLGREKSEVISIVVMDMWDPYIASVRKNCPNAAIVFDKFHISKKINEALDSIRKAEFKKADDVERKDMKRKRFLILSRQKRLNDDQRETIEDLKRINARLYEAYLLKEQVLDIFDETNVHAALVRLGKWMANVQLLGIAPFLKVISTMKNYWYGIANYFRLRLTNAASEGFNNKINIIKRRAYGFRDLEYFMLKILQSCGWRAP